MMHTLDNLTFPPSKKQKCDNNYNGNYTFLFHGNCIDGWFSAYIAHTAIKEKNAKYFFDKDNLLPEYNGSYHITFTLPYTDKTDNKEFIKMHQNFCNQLQWLEPLLLTSYFSATDNKLSVPKILVFTASKGKNSHDGTCFKAAA